MWGVIAAITGGVIICVLALLLVQERHIRGRIAARQEARLRLMEEGLLQLARQNKELRGQLDHIRSEAGLGDNPGDSPGARSAWEKAYERWGMAAIAGIAGGVLGKLAQQASLHPNIARAAVATVAAGAITGGILLLPWSKPTPDAGPYPLPGTHRPTQVQPTPWPAPSPSTDTSTTTLRTQFTRSPSPGPDPETFVPASEPVIIVSETTSPNTPPSTEPTLSPRPMTPTPTYDPPTPTPTPTPPPSPPPTASGQACVVYVGVGLADLGLDLDIGLLCEDALVTVA